MGSIAAPSGIGDALFTATQQKVLGLLFGRPDRSFYANEIVRLTEGGTGAVHRQLEKLGAAGLVVITRVGNQRHFQANARSPIFDELRAIVRKTFGLADVLREALARLEERCDVAFVYGSVASGVDTADSDVDLLVVGRRLSYPDVMSVLGDAEASLGRKISPTIYSASQLRRKLEDDNAFVRRVMDRPKIFLVGSPSDLPG